MYGLQSLHQMKEIKTFNESHEQVQEHNTMSPARAWTQTRSI